MRGNTTTILMVFVVMLYMPPIIAFGASTRAGLVSRSLGWTLIGWIAVLLWASLTHAESAFG